MSSDYVVGCLILFDVSLFNVDIQVNGNHETMNVEGDFRYVDSGAFDECLNFLEYLEDYRDHFEEAFLNWIQVSERWKDQRKSQNFWGPMNLVKVHGSSICLILLVYLIRITALEHNKYVPILTLP